MAKRKNHTSHNENAKAHRNGIKRERLPRFQSMKGMDQKFVRNQKFARRGSLRAAAAAKAKAKALARKAAKSA